MDPGMWISQVTGADSATNNSETLRNLKPLSFCYFINTTELIHAFYLELTNIKSQLS